jgi:hypothetical protein
MARWLVVGTALVITLLVLLWLQIQSPSAEPTHTPTIATAEAPVAALTATRGAELAQVTQQIAEAQGKPTKLDPASDAFFYRFDEAIPPALTAEAAKCYTGGLRRVHRNQKVKLGYKIHIRDGVVSIADVRVVESTVSDKALEECFALEVGKVTWRDDELPDWTQDDELVIRPERGMKKFTAENLAYEGDGPIGKLEVTGPVAASRELPLN